MQVHFDYRNLHERYPRIVVGLGNFDGVHLGHQELIRSLVRYARDIGGTPTIFTFHPHPVTVLKPGMALPLLLSQEAKQEFFERLGVEVLLLVRFDLDFARLTPEQFIADVIYGELRAAAVFVGYNYTFGHMGKGTPATLAEYAPRYNYHLQVIPAVEVNGLVVSSTHIRNLLQEGNVEEAASLLGYSPFVEGTVVTGDSRGSRLGFPTANLRCPEEVLIPANGVYAVHVRVGRQTFLGVANIGTRPTFAGDGERLIEVHILDFSGDIYGHELRVVFVKRLRGERAFGSADELVAQIRRDINAARVVGGRSLRHNLQPG
ncbi:MAG: bifunctional riboflavin kinase/FAD synthetase [Desulfotomaculales bacterium]